MMSIYEKIKVYIYYILIGITCFIVLVIAPLLGSDPEVGFNFPKTAGGWAFWAVIRLVVSVCTILIFHCFVRQGDENTRNNQERIKAEKELYGILMEKEIEYKSPKDFLSGEYIKKMPSIFTSSAMSLVAFGGVILNYDFAMFLSFILVVLMSVIFGILEMKKVETYYIYELPKYVESLKNKKKMEDKKCQNSNSTLKTQSDTLANTTKQEEALTSKTLSQIPMIGNLGKMDYMPLERKETLNSITKITID